MDTCFDELPLENLPACVNNEVQAGISEVDVNYAIHPQITTFPMPLNFGDPGYTYETAVTVTEDIVFQAGKGFGTIAIMPDSGEVTVDLVGNKGNKKTKSSFPFAVSSNNKKVLGFMRTHKNTPMIFCVRERDGQKRLIGDAFNPAYIVEGKATTGKGGEDDKVVNFTFESYCVPIVYSGAVQEPAAVTP
ncbi:hypothetical protein [Flavobacterium sp. 14A]|uniref:hypothetical protein n=1 Tax=Flavobacterium sp. 14A TaxID=2735896 RepID=UPI0015702D6F|nr:hypothetical protein [Flavobacterium sp. 14A]NRT11520.1 hypothetical protein [Flavobacterium sp. 14A]